MAPVGTLLGLIIAGICAAGVVETDPEDCYNRLKAIVYIQNGIYTVTCILVLVFMREKPEKPPSKLALTMMKLD